MNKGDQIWIRLFPGDSVVPATMIDPNPNAFGLIRVRLRDGRDLSIIPGRVVA